LKTSEVIVRQCPKHAKDALKVLLTPLKNPEQQGVVLPVKQQLATSLASLVSSQLFTAKMRVDINLAIITEAALARSS
jgi:hypothetical protein